MLMILPKAIELLPLSKIEFIPEELIGSAAHVVCDRFGLLATKVLLKLPGKEGMKAKHVMQRAKAKVQSTRHGRHVLSDMGI